MYLELLQSVDMVKVMDDGVELDVSITFIEQTKKPSDNVIHVSWVNDNEEYGFSVTDKDLDKAVVKNNMLTVESNIHIEETLKLYNLKPVNILEEI